MGKVECSICNAPADVRTAIDEALLKKEKLRDLAARTAFSRASLSRHSIKHLQRNLLASHKWHSRYDPQRHRLWMVGPGDSPMIRDVQPARFWNHSARLKPEDVQDVILRVRGLAQRWNLHSCSRLSPFATTGRCGTVLRQNEK